MQGPLRSFNGCFVLHKIQLDGMKSKVSAWFDKDGKLLDCEAIDVRGRPRKVPASKHKELELIGARHKHTPAVSESQEEESKRLIHEIVLCVKANNVSVTGELLIGLAFRTLSQLRQIARELHIKVEQ